MKEGKERVTQAEEMVGQRQEGRPCRHPLEGTTSKSTLLDVADNAKGQEWCGPFRVGGFLVPRVGAAYPQCCWCLGLDGCGGEPAWGIIRCLAAFLDSTHKMPVASLSKNMSADTAKYSLGRKYPY